MLLLRALLDQVHSLTNRLHWLLLSVSHRRLTHRQTHHVENSLRVGTRHQTRLVLTVARRRREEVVDVVLVVLQVAHLQGNRVIAVSEGLFELGTVHPVDDVAQGARNQSHVSTLDKMQFPYPSGPNTVYVFPLPVTPYAITRQLFPRKKPSRRGFVVVSKTLSYHYSN